LLSTLSKLTALNLSMNRNLLSVPVYISVLTNLTYLDVESCDIEQWPSFISTLTNLNHLSLKYNRILSPIGSDISTLSNLTFLDLTGVPCMLCFEISVLTNLTVLNGYTLLDEMPPGITALTKIGWIKRLSL